MKNVQPGSKLFIYGGSLNGDVSSGNCGCQTVGWRVEVGVGVEGKVGGL